MRWLDMRALCRASGVPWGTLVKIRYETTRDPRSSTIDALRAAMLAQEKAQTERPCEPADCAA